MPFKMKGMNKIMSNTKGTKAFKHAMKVKGNGFRNMEDNRTNQQVYEDSLKLATNDFTEVDLYNISPEEKQKLSLKASDEFIKEKTEYDTYEELVEKEGEDDGKYYDLQYSNNQFYKSAERVDINDLTDKQRKVLKDRLGEGRSDEELNQIYAKDGKLYFDQGWAVTGEKQVNTPVMITDIIEAKPAKVISTARNQGTGEKVNITEDSVKYRIGGSSNEHTFSKDNPFLPETGNKLDKKQANEARKWERLNNTDKNRVVDTINDKINRFGDEISTAEATEREIGEFELD